MNIKCEVVIVPEESEPVSPSWILIVDDEFDIIAAFKQGLERQGYQVFAFTDALLALEHFKINSEKYGLVISDLRMPGMNGYEFIKRIKEIKIEVKVFFMTAFEIDDVEFKRVLPSVEIDEFIQKPITINDLTGVISKYVSVQLEAGE